MGDLVKTVLIVLGYCVAGPALGALIKNNRRAQQWLFCLLVFMTSWHINKITLMLDSIEWYRGATKGFEFSSLEICAIALLTASFLKRERPWQLLAPGTGLYLLYVAMSCVSIFAAPIKIYVAMAGLRFLKVVLVYLAAFHFFR